jgi:hypothetical protein
MMENANQQFSRPRAGDGFRGTRLGGTRCGSLKTRTYDFRIGKKKLASIAASSCTLVT